MEAPAHTTVTALRRPTVTCVLVVALFYLIPIEPGVTGTQLALRSIATLLAGLLVTWLILRQIRQHVVSPEGSLVGLVITLVVGVAFFALADYVTALSGADQFADLKTKTDAMYFALTTLTTVGYGDVHATGQIARLVVSAQLLFNVVVIATGASVLTREIGNRARQRRTPGPR